MKVADRRRSAEVVDPEWKPWIDLVELAVAEADAGPWFGSAVVGAQRSTGAPLLHGATLRVDPARASIFVRQLAERLGLDIQVDPLALILVGVERDADTLSAFAHRLAAPPDTVAVFAQLSAVPLLLNASRALSADDSRTWQRGYCPVCGAWPSLVELRGIQRERRMRCGCCGSDWMLPVLRCPFCDELDHQKLGSLLSEGDEQRVRVETCSTCHGYLKSVTTLSALPFGRLAERDASTVAFDLAAQERGYARPAKPGWQLQVEIVQ
jgi:FdhE protein